MNQINTLIDDIPDPTSLFQVNLVGSVTKKTFLGEFVCRIPTIKDQAQIAKFEAFLNGEYPVYLNAGVLKVHKQIAYLKFTLTDTPKFWRDAEDGYNLRDPNIIDNVYNQVLAFEETWYKKIWGEDIINGSADEAGTEEDKEKEA